MKYNLALYLFMGILLMGPVQSVNFTLDNVVADQYEPDNEFLSPSKITFGELQDRSISEFDDVDFVYFILEEDATVDIRTFVGDDGDTRMKLYSNNYTQLAEDIRFSDASRIFINLTAGVYVMEVYPAYDIIFNYQLSLEVYTAAIDQYEPNNNIASAIPVTFNTTFTDLSLGVDDLDYFNFTLAENKIIHLEVLTTEKYARIFLTIIKDNSTVTDFYYVGGVMDLTAGDYTIEFKSTDVGNIFYNFTLSYYVSEDVYESNDIREDATQISSSAEIQDLDLAPSYPELDVDWFNISIAGESAGDYLIIETETLSYGSVQFKVYNETSNSEEQVDVPLPFPKFGSYFPITGNAEYVLVKVFAYEGILNYSLSVSVRTKAELGFDNYDDDEYGFNEYSGTDYSKLSVMTSSNLSRTVGGYDKYDYAIFELQSRSQFSINYNVEYPSSSSSGIYVDFFYLGMDNSSLEYGSGTGIPYNARNSVFQFGGEAGFYLVLITGSYETIDYTISVSTQSFNSISDIVDNGDIYEVDTFSNPAFIAFNETLERSLTRFSQDVDINVFNVTDDQPSSIKIDVLDFEVNDPDQVASINLNFYSFSGNLSDFKHTNLDFISVELTADSQSVIIPTFDAVDEGQYYVSVYSSRLQYLHYNISQVEYVAGDPIIFTPPPENTDDTSNTSTGTSDTSTETTSNTTSQDTEGDDNGGIWIAVTVVLITSAIVLVYFYRDKLFKPKRT